MKVCLTCVYQKRGEVMPEAMGRIHADTNPNHEVVEAEHGVEMGPMVGLEDTPQTKKHWWAKKS